jgi:hypothetical protein
MTTTLARDRMVPLVSILLESGWREDVGRLRCGEREFQYCPVI